MVFFGHTVYMFLRLRRRGIELEEKTASKSVSKWPRESLRDSRNYIMALRAFKIVASRLCFFGAHRIHVFAASGPWNRVRGKNGIEIGVEMAERVASRQ